MNKMAVVIILLLTGCFLGCDNQSQRKRQTATTPEKNKREKQVPAAKVTKKTEATLSVSSKVPNDRKGATVDLHDIGSSPIGDRFQEESMKKDVVAALRMPEIPNAPPVPDVLKGPVPDLNSLIKGASDSDNRDATNAAVRAAADRRLKEMNEQTRVIQSRMENQRIESESEKRREREADQRRQNNLNSRWRAAEEQERKLKEAKEKEDEAVASRIAKTGPLPQTDMLLIEQPILTLTQSKRSEIDFSNDGKFLFCADDYTKSTQGITGGLVYKVTNWQETQLNPSDRRKLAPPSARYRLASDSGSLYADVNLSPNGNLLATWKVQNGKTVEVIALANRRLVHAIDLRDIQDFERNACINQYDQWGFSPDGQLFALPLSDVKIDNKRFAFVRLYDTQTWKLSKTLRGSDAISKYCRSCSSLHIISFSPNSKRLFTKSSDGFFAAITMWDVSTGSILRQMDTFNFSQGVLNKDGRTLATGYEDTDTRREMVNIWNVETGQLKARIYEPKVISIALSPDAGLIATFSENSGVYHLKIWDTTKGRIVPFEDAIAEYKRKRQIEREEEHELNSRASPQITLVQYKNIRLGMSYDDVKRSLGGPAFQVSEPTHNMAGTGGFGTANVFRFVAKYKGKGMQGEAIFIFEGNTTNPPLKEKVQNGLE